MDSRKAYYTRSQRILRTVSWGAMLLTTAVVLTPGSWKPYARQSTPQSFAGNHRFLPAFMAKQEPASFGEEGLLPTVLGEADRERYRAIFAAQKKADWTAADQLIGELENDVLLGYVLADRYNNPKYQATTDELAGWLKHYNDHPQAPDLYARTVSVDPARKDDLPFVKKAEQLANHGDIFSMSSKAYDTPYQSIWQAGLASWKTGRKGDAAKLFASVAKHKDEVSPWMASAAAYWAHRSYNATGNHKVAAEYLAMAAEYPRTFYGVIARKQLKQPLGLDTQPVQLTENDVLQMVGDQSVRRIIALTEAGYSDMAEKELRSRYPGAEADEKNRLLALAHELGLASVQISMAHDLAVEGRELDFARYPIPSCQPEGGFRVDPLLIFSLMRQESGFKQTAVSPVGALGLMQLMPQTAALVHKQMFGKQDNLPTRNAVAEPTLNLTLGQNYVETLLTNPLVEGNLFYLLAAYNAGPGRLQEWKANLNYKNDPLLFVESIPFGETRHYVMQVMTNYWMYSELVGSENESVVALLHGKWPAYSAEGTPLADALSPQRHAANDNSPRKRNS